MNFDTTISSRPKYLDLELREIWKYKDMLFFLVIRDFKIRFKQSFLGLLWACLQPLISLVVFTVIFGSYLNIQFDGPYPLFCLSGLILWNYFAKVFSGSTNSVVQEAELLKKVYFPRLILPLSQSLSHFIDFLITFVILIGFMVYYQWFPGGNVVYAPVFIFLNMFFAIALALWLAPINVRFRDIQIVLPLLIQSLMFLSPVIYPPDRLTGWVKDIYYLNPMVGIIEGFRFSLLNHGELNHQILTLPCIIISLLFITGLYFFQYQKNKFADII